MDLLLSSSEEAAHSYRLHLVFPMEVLDEKSRTLPHTPLVLPLSTEGRPSRAGFTPSILFPPTEVQFRKKKHKLILTFQVLAEETVGEETLQSVEEEPPASPIVPTEVEKDWRQALGLTNRLMYRLCVQ